MVAVAVAVVIVAGLGFVAADTTNLLRGNDTVNQTANVTSNDTNSSGGTNTTSVDPTQNSTSAGTTETKATSNIPHTEGKTVVDESTDEYGQTVTKYSDGSESIYNDPAYIKNASAVGSYNHV
jgi:hypothetical protein